MAPVCREFCLYNTQEGLRKDSKENVSDAQQKVRAFSALESLQMRGHHDRQKKSEKVLRKLGRWEACKA